MKSMAILFLLIGFLTACSNRNTQSTITDDEGSGICIKQEIKYAKGFDIYSFKNYKLIIVFDPWNPPDTLAAYCICSDKNLHAPGCEFHIVVPVNRVACLSSTNVAMMNLIDESAGITACSDAELIYDSLLYHRYLNGELVDLGNTQLVNAEMLIDHAPDIVMKYLYGTKEMVDEKIINAGLSVVFNLEFMENHPLGRAEWIKFVAAFFDKDLIADSVFSSIEAEYLRLADLCAERKEKPTVLDGSSYKGVWYTAGGQSYSAKMYADAGADYYWQSDSNKGSIPVSFETVIDKQANADYWLGPSTGNRKELLNIDGRYTKLKAFREGNVYFFGKRMNPNGGLDYFESGVARPDLVLKDLIWLFHPELLDPDFNTFYLEKIN
jgi:iron complex transport system substrate-binding protein